ncbi:unnamed protein product [Phyllotreta striolata]|uniref:Uncharacterized protein n=1 Tax=Phyllotreta striolata TaxID=444603 RepID=A0A9N9XPE3_PHYSR|nr:unnamed protein product [Phyllotreta striolata]
MENEGIVPLNNKSVDPINMSNHSIDLYYFIMSPPSRAVLITMKALGINPNIIVTNPMAGDTMKPDYLKLNPLHTIPTINDEGFVLYDSGAIMKYLVDQYGKDDSLYPKDPKKGARVAQRLFFVSGTLFPGFFKTHIPVVMGRTAEEADKEKLREALTYMDKLLEDSKWMAGNSMTVADFAVITLLSTIESSGLFDVSFYPNLWQWFQQCKNAMSSFGYEEIVQAGADAFGGMVKKSAE